MACRWWRSETGLTLVEVVVAMVIIAVVLLPLANTYYSGEMAQRSAARETKMVNAAQAILEQKLSLSFSDLSVQDPPFSDYPGEERLRYKVEIEKYSGRDDLKQVTVTLKRVDEGEDEVRLTTLVSRREAP